jgi:hypothetical protein
MTPLIPRKVHSFRNYNGGAGVGVYRGGILRKTRNATWLQRAIQRSTGALAIVFRPHGVREVNLSSERSAASSGSKSL